jgi:hypothetical protein
MKGRRLTVQLLRVGRAAAGGARGGTIRIIALLCAAAALTLGIGTLVTAASVYQGIAERSEGRNPRVLEAHPRDRPIALWKAGFDEVGGLQYSLVSVVPLRADAPPPCVAAWPGPRRVSATLHTN